MIKQSVSKHLENNFVAKWEDCSLLGPRPDSPGSEVLWVPPVGSKREVALLRAAAVACLGVPNMAPRVWRPFLEGPLFLSLVRRSGPPPPSSSGNKVENRGREVLGFCSLPDRGTWQSTTEGHWEGCGNTLIWWPGKGPP